MSDVGKKLAFNAREAAESIGVSVRTLWTLTKRKEVPHVRLGSRVLYPVDLLRDWLRRRGVGDMISEKGG